MNLQDAVLMKQVKHTKTNSTFFDLHVEDKKDLTEVKSRVVVIWTWEGYGAGRVVQGIRNRYKGTVG